MVGIGISELAVILAILCVLGGGVVSVVAVIVFMARGKKTP